MDPGLPLLDRQSTSQELVELSRGWVLSPAESIATSLVFVWSSTAMITPPRLDRGVQIHVLVLSVPLSFLSKIVGN